ncbi:MAG: chromosome segregation protein SMC [archaeon]
MTRITKLEIKGFKSFGNKTELLFGEKFNCILGPNGSGKSNVIDALCFVLGKSSVKGMRAEKSINLIYNGGKAKNPSKEAEVSIYLDNTNNEFPLPEKEIKLTRLIRDKTGKEKLPDGEEPTAATHGIYKINGKTRTRQQVLDLLSHVRINPDGYNIILQGDIVKLVEMSLIERRQIIEEIAGISIYEEKKGKAIRELQKVEEKLNEADIILAERNTYLKELKKERDQAMKFKRLDDQLKSNKATLLNSQMETRKNDEEANAQLLTGTQKKIQNIQADIAKIKQNVQDKKQEIESINKEVEQKGEKEQVAIHRDVEQLKVTIAVKKQRQETLQGELKKLAERKTQLEQGLAELKTKLTANEESKKSSKKELDQKQKLILDLDKKIEGFKKKNMLDNLGEIDQQIEALDKEADVLQEDIIKMREEQQNLLREKDKLEVVLSGIDEKIAKVLELNKKNKNQLDQLRGKQDEYKKISLELNKALSEDASLASQLSTARAKLLSRKEEKAKAEARNIGIREGIAGGVAITKIMELRQKKPGIIGIVSDLGQVSSKFALALEVAAGQRLRSIVVEDDQVAQECINYLRNNKFGVASFLPLNKMKQRPLPTGIRAKKGQGVYGPCVDLVSYDKRYSAVFDYVFEHTLVVEDIDTARKTGMGEWRMVTLQGDLIEKSGAMHGGFRQKSRDFGFQDKELSDQQEKLDKEIADLTSMVETLDEKKTDMDEDIAKFRLRKSELEGEISAMEKTLHFDSADLDVSKKQKEQIKKELAEASKKLDAVMDNISEKNKTIANVKIKKQELRNKITELRNPALLAELNAFEQKKREVQDDIIRMQGEIKNFDNELANMLAPERDNIEKIFKQQDKEKKEFDNEHAALQKELKDLLAQLAAKEDQEKKFYSQFKELFNKRTKASNELNKLENTIAQKEDLQRQIEQKANVYGLEQAKFRAELSRLQEEFKQYEHVELFKDKPEEQIRKEIAQFEKMVEDIGAVNMKALDVYASAEKDYHSLMGKKETLGKEREDVLLMINEIDTKKKELFMKTFDVVNQNFKNIFAALSTKGDAFLDLEDKHDPFNGGMTIKVKISSKKFLDIRSLSGGEKTLTALAFLFSVQDYEPAAFYILDEVDAALDKRNSEKLAKLVKAYSEKAQYLIISHNDAVISTADNLYGVSMQDDGISKVTSLKI